MRNAKCEVRNAKCEVRNAKCEVRSAKCEVAIANEILYLYFKLSVLTLNLRKKTTFLKIFLKNFKFRIIAQKRGFAKFKNN